MKDNFLFACFLAAHVSLFAQALPPQNPAGDSNPAAASGLPHERAVSWKLLPTNLAHDQKNIWKFPLDVAKGKHLKPAVGFVLATAGLVALDPHDAPYFRRTTRFHEWNSIMSGRNTALAMAVFPATAWALGRARRDSYGQQTALLAGEAVAGSEILALAMKSVDRRLRPSDIQPGGDFSHTWFKSHDGAIGLRASFPSGHTIAAFSLAAIFAGRYHRRWVPWVAYGAAGVIGLSRLTLQAHFPSDIFAGAVLGYFISHDVVLGR